MFAMKILIIQELDVDALVKVEPNEVERLFRCALLLDEIKLQRKSKVLWRTFAHMKIAHR